MGDGFMAVQECVRVWDLLVRVFHWLLVLAFSVSYLTEGEPQSVHVWSGYVIATLLVIRIAWGFVGHGHARFADFVVGPVHGGRHLVREIRGDARRYLGHNPAGASMILALLVSLLLTVAAGLYLHALENDAGPWAWLAPDPRVAATARVQHEGAAGTGGEERPGAEAVAAVHAFLANVTLLLIVVHIAGVVLGSVRHRENLPAAMWHGHKRPPDG